MPTSNYAAQYHALGNALSGKFDELLVADMLDHIPTVESWLSSIPEELDAEAITTVLKQHFPKLFV